MARARGCARFSQPALREPIKIEDDNNSYSWNMVENVRFKSERAFFFSIFLSDILFSIQYFVSASKIKKRMDCIL